MKNTRRILGMSFKGQPIYAPKHSHSLLLSAAGGGKTTCGAMPWLQSILADTSRAIVITDSKEGEIAAQAASMCTGYGRKVAIVDPFAVLGTANPYRVNLNPLGGVHAAHAKKNGELLFASDNACHALIEEPADDARNRHWREEPRTLQEFAMNVLLKRQPRYFSPGGVWSLISDPVLLEKKAKEEIEEGDAALKSLARHVIGMSANQEHFPQHRAAAAKALRIYGAGSPLHSAGIDARITHRQLIEEKYIVFLVGPVRYMERLGPDYALQLQSFMEVLLSGGSSPVSFILDEFTAAPLKKHLLPSLQPCVVTADVVT